MTSEDQPTSSRSGSMKGMPQFSIKTLFGSIAFVAAGTWIIVAMLRDADESGGMTLWPFWFVAGILIGVGLLLPLRRPGLGVYVGVIVQFYMLNYVSTRNMHYLLTGIAILVAVISGQIWREFQNRASSNNFHHTR